MKTLSRLYIGAFLALLSAPLIVAFGVSLNEKRVLFFPPRGFSLTWYQELLFHPDWRLALITSLVVAAGAALVALSVALPVAYMLWRYNLRYARVLFLLGLMPFALPPVITAIGMLSFWAEIGWTGRIENLIIGHGVFMVTLPMVMISLGLESISREQLEAAETLGATRRQVFTTVILPLIRPYIFSGVVFVVVFSMNEFVISFFLGQFNTVTLPVKIVTQLRSGYSPVVASAAMFFLAMAVVGFALVARLGDLPKLLGAGSAGD
ncbi:ABC transporter permease [Oricola sp.]|uniref:ABC transporter permease n=1 Tax=Oricola sp. TaxID=1979950 RepID=UPI003BAA05E5